MGIRGRGVNIKSFDMEHPYMWRGGTVKTILTRMEYTGCTVNFRTKKESYKDKRPTKVDSSEWIIFEDTQEPIIQQAYMGNGAEAVRYSKKKRCI